MPTCREFSMHLRCNNCVRPSVRSVVVPKVEGAPSTVEEFLNSAAMEGVPFHCRYCESSIGTLVAVTMVGADIEEVWEAHEPMHGVA